MNKFKMSKLIIAITTILLLSVSLLFISTKDEEKPIFNSLKNSIAIIDSWIAKPFTAVSGLAESVTDFLNTYDENKILKSSLSETENLISENESLKMENESLKASISSSSDYETSFNLVAEVTVRNPSNWLNSLTINKGSSDGVSNNMLIISNGSVIGYLSEVNANSSEVTLLTDTDNTEKLSVKLTTDSGVIYGIISGYDTDNDLFIVTQLTSTEGLTTGLNVVTSDLAGDKPGNLIVGDVVSFSQNADTLETEVFVRPRASFSNIYSVNIVGE